MSLWAVLSPVATLAIFIVVFSRVQAFPTQGIPYALYAFVGILCWSFFASSLGSGGNSLLANKALLAKTQFPRECFPLETMLVNALNTVISFIPLTLLFVIFGRAPRIATVWVPLFMVIEVVFAAGVTLAVSSLIIQMRDLVQVLPDHHLARHLRHPGHLAVLVDPDQLPPVRRHRGPRALDRGLLREPPGGLRLLQSTRPGDRQRPRRPCCSATTRVGRRCAPRRSAPSPTSASATGSSSDSR